ncbi:MAG: helix-turn-helix domain-containing protein [SAR324 cluster bacterium]|nr:helix-turn-helix domain-containing protein [SAR324 cluster bacterium]
MGRNSFAPGGQSNKESISFTQKLQSGKSGKEVSSMLCICRQTVSKWVGRLREEGMAG